MAHGFGSAVFVCVSRPAGPSCLQVIPIYTQSDTNDVLIRAYTKCPAYQDNLEAWFRSEEFRKKEDETSALRAKVGAASRSVAVYGICNWRGGQQGAHIPTAVCPDTCVLEQVLIRLHLLPAARFNTRRSGWRCQAWTPL